MNNDEKSIAYAFIANGVQIYLSDSLNYFTISKLICNNCGHSWYMNLTECFLCGALNPFLYRCGECGSFQSITKSSGKCSKCNSIKLVTACPNPDCLSNKNERVFEEANKFGGVFNKDSGLLISQQYCIKCGNDTHRYQNYKIYVRKINKDKIDFKDLGIKQEEITDKTRLIIKRVGKNNTISYGLLKLKEFINKPIALDGLRKDFNLIAEELFPIN